MVWKSIKCVDQINTENSFEKCCMVVQTKKVIWLFHQLLYFSHQPGNSLRFERPLKLNLLTKGKGAEEGM